jgi:5'-nucleotidase
MEGAGNGIPALAVSLETDLAEHLSYSTAVDFSTAAYFTALFGRMILQRELPFDVDLLKVDVPSDATPQTPWEVTRLSRQTYFEAVRPKRASWNEPEAVGYRRVEELSGIREDSDVYALRVKRVVSVTPLSLDLTARVDLSEFDQFLRGN